VGTWGTGAFDSDDALDLKYVDSPAMVALACRDA
jgi:hypothetical protein